MRQIPVKQTRSMPNVPKASQDENSPVLLLARKIRREQGVEQLRAFLSATEPFISPNELKSVCAAFGLNFNALPKNQIRQTTFRSGNISGRAPQNTARMNVSTGNRGMKMSGGGNINAGMNANIGGVNANAGTKSGGNTGASHGTGNPNRSGNINQRNRAGTNQNFGNAGNTGGSDMNRGANRAGFDINGDAGMNSAVNINNDIGTNTGAGMNAGMNTNGNSNFGFNRSGQGSDPIQMMQMLMQMQNLMNSGGDMRKLLNFLGLV